MSANKPHKNDPEQQQGLGDFEYSQYEKKTPDEYIKQVEEGDDIFSLTKADQVWINGVVYTVIGRRPTLIASPVKYVIGEDGSQRQLTAGQIDGENAAGVTWGSNISGKSKDEITRSTLISSYDEVYITYQGDELKHFHDIIPDADTRECPNCGSAGGMVKHSEVQQNTVIEVRVCSDSDCKEIYRLTQPINQDSKAQLLIRNHAKNKFELNTLTGFYEVEDQDDFLAPMETHDGAHDGYRTAEQIATLLNKKMGPEGINPILQRDESFSVSELLNLLSFKTISHGVAATTETELNDWGDILVEHFSKVRNMPSVEHIATHLSESTPRLFANVLYAITGVKQELTTTDPQETISKSNEPNKSDLDIIEEMIMGEKPPIRNSTEKKIAKRLTEDITGEDFLTSTAFYELLTETAEDTVFGETTYDQGRFDQLDKENANLVWRDSVKSHEQMMEVTYTEFYPHEREEFSVGWLWDMREFDPTLQTQTTS